MIALASFVTGAVAADSRVREITIEYRLQVKRTGFRANDAYSAYIEMGAPTALSAEQLNQLQGLTRDVPETDRKVTVGASGDYSVDVSMRTNDVVLVTLTPGGSA